MLFTIILPTYNVYLCNYEVMNVIKLIRISRPCYQLEAKVLSRSTIAVLLSLKFIGRISIQQRAEQDVLIY